MESSQKWIVLKKKKENIKRTTDVLRDKKMDKSGMKECEGAIHQVSHQISQSISSQAVAQLEYVRMAQTVETDKFIPCPRASADNVRALRVVLGVFIVI